jgi:hypothetical protein
MGIGQVELEVFGAPPYNEYELWSDPSRDNAKRAGSGGSEKAAIWKQTPTTATTPSTSTGPANWYMIQPLSQSLR